MEIVVVKREEFDYTAAMIAVDQIISKADSTIGFATGNTTLGMHGKLAQIIIDEKIDISRINTFNLDDYFGIPQNHPKTGFSRMHSQLFDKIGIKPEQTHFLKSDAGDWREECSKFAKDIEECGGIDLQFIGIGLNGHIAFCEPGTSFDTDYFVINISEEARKSKIALFGSLEDVPEMGISMGIKSIMQCRKNVLLAKGIEKADIVQKAVLGPVTPDVPASALQTHPNLVVLLDEDAASGIKRW